MLAMTDGVDLGRVWPSTSSDCCICTCRYLTQSQVQLNQLGNRRLQSGAYRERRGGLLVNLNLGGLWQSVRQKRLNNVKPSP